MRKKQLGALLLAGIMAVLPLSGCGAMPSTGNRTEESADAGNTDTSGDKEGAEGKQEDSNEKITLRIVDWSDGSAQQREKFHEKYMEEHPNITIEYTMLTVDQFKNTIVTMIKSGDGPDIFPIPGGMTLKTAVEEGWYQPINSFVTEDFAGQFDPRSFEEGVTHIGDEW
ncbi:MAG: extracellular solute-binding protein, partial [Kineothrix sp.]|nr:extracellular solute-binding protein [Kineothrix sp.]